MAPRRSLRLSNLDRIRRRCGRWAIVGVVALVGGCDQAPRDDAAVLESLTPVSTVTAWSFVDRPDAEQLLACVAGIAPVFVSVTRDDPARMVIDDSASGAPIAIWTVDATFVRSDEVGVTGTDWVLVDRSDAAVVEPIRDILGPALADWAFSDALPAAPGELVAAVVESAEILEVTPPLGVSGRVFEAAVSDDDAPAENGPGGVVVPVLTITIVDGRIDTIAARPARDSTEFGFRWEFEPTTSAPAAPPDDWRVIDASDIAVPSASEIVCEVGQ